MGQDRINVAVVGATGAVGEEFLKLLVERNFPYKTLKLLASARSVGKRLRVGNEELEVEELRPESFAGVDLAFFSAGAGVSREFAPRAVAAGAVVVDNSSAFRMDEGVPLVVPEVNPEDLRWHKSIIANPNCSTIILALPLYALHREVGVRRVVVSTYQAVSGAGARAMQELQDQLRRALRGEPVTPGILPVASAPRHYPIAFNVIPQVDVFAEDGFTKEEWKMVRETCKIFHAPELKVAATTVRVPVLRSHAESVQVELERPVTVDEARDIMGRMPGVVVWDRPEEQVYPMPYQTSGTDPVYVGRVRRDPTVAAGLLFWVVGDQIRKGAALNGIQIAELLLQQGLLTPAS